jgi:hypothetical protein
LSRDDAHPQNERDFVMAYVKTTAAAVAVIMLLTGCATQPLEPTVAVAPPPKKLPEAFQVDQAVCKQYADQQVADYQENPSVALGVMMVGLILIPGLGWAWAGERGVIVGGALGLGGGAALGVSEEERTRSDAQRRYDLAYQQCMYVEGNDVAGFEPSMLLATP